MTRATSGKLTTLGAGKFAGGVDVPAGLYDVTSGGDWSGNFIVTGTSSYNEILRGTDSEEGGVTRVRAEIALGDAIQIAGLESVTFTPVTAPPVTTHGTATLYTGTWTVGQDIAPGRYVATPVANESGNFIVFAAGVNEVLGGSHGVSSVTFSLQAGDVVRIAGLSQVALTAVA